MRNSVEGLLRFTELFEKKIGYTFKDAKNMILALTHSSFANESKNKALISNERLEFLGDAVLNIVVSENIYMKYPYLSEGEMTKARANIVCETTLVKCADDLDLGAYLLLGKGEENTRGRNRASILSDVFEAIIGSIYIDGGIKSAKEFILKQMKELIESSVDGSVFMDYKTQFQEMVQKKSNKKIKYEIVDEKGPDHEKFFVMQVKIVDDIMGKGQGKSKKEAEQKAAKAALKQLITKM